MIIYRDEEIILSENNSIILPDSYRTLMIGNKIDQCTTRDIVSKIVQFNADDVNAVDRKPIRILINSNGGVVYDGFAIINAILSSKTHVITENIGQASSMAFPIFLAGHKRLVHPHSVFMYHGLAWGSYTDVANLERTTDELKRLTKMMDNIIINNTSITQDRLDEVKKLRIDWYIRAEEAVIWDIGEIMGSETV